MELLSSLKKEEILEVLSHGDGFCHHCEALVQARIRSLHKRKLNETSDVVVDDDDDEGFVSFRDALDMPVNCNNVSNSESSTRRREKQWNTPPPRNSFQRNESSFPMKGYRDTSLYQRNRHTSGSSPRYLGSKKQYSLQSDFDLLLNDGIGGDSSFENELSEEQKERIRFSQVHRKKNFALFERIDGREINVLQGLELHTRVFNFTEQKKIVDYIYRLQRMGKQGQLRERTYSEPRKWMRGKGRITIQFGCCYNYAVDKYGNPPGIIRDEEVDPIPSLFKKMIKRMVRWQILPPTCIPDSCIVNIYDKGDCIPPHIDHHDFVRPFCTVSFLSECDILFGSNLQVVSPGEFSGPASISLPVGSVFILNGNGANIAKHCVPAVPSRRISITFRKMDNRKLPYKFSPDPELFRIKPLTFSPPNKPLIRNGKFGNSQIQKQKAYSDESESDKVWKTRKDLFHEEDEFPPLKGSFTKLKANKFGRRE